MGIIRINSNPETIEPFRDVIEYLSDTRSNLRFGSDYSVTEIIDSPQAIQLKRRFPDQLKVDKIINALPAFIGHAVHDRFERILRQYSSINKKYAVERRLHDYILYRRLAGRLDILQQLNILWDVKVTSAWKLVLGDISDWESQLNIYAKMLRKDGVKVKSLRILAIFLDWKKQLAKSDPKYPQSKILELELALWKPKEQCEFVKERLQLHIDAEKVKPENLPECTNREMWASETKYAVYADNKAKRAWRVLDDHKKAWAMCKSKFPKGFVQKRLGVRKRCQEWCSAASICRQYGRHLKETILA